MIEKFKNKLKKLDSTLYDQFEELLPDWWDNELLNSPGACQGIIIEICKLLNIDLNSALTDSEELKYLVRKPSHPGLIFKRQYVEPLDFQVSSIVEITGISEHDILSFMEGKISCDEDMAKKLEKFTDISAGFWLRLQKKFDDHGFCDGLEDQGIVTLTDNEAKKLGEILDSPPRPNNKVKEAMDNYQKTSSDKICPYEFLKEINRFVIKDWGKNNNEN